MATFRPVGLALNQTILHSEVELLLQILLLKNCHYIALKLHFYISTHVGNSIFSNCSSEPPYELTNRAARLPALSGP